MNGDYYNPYASSSKKYTAAAQGYVKGFNTTLTTRMSASSMTNAVRAFETMLSDAGFTNITSFSITLDA